VLPILSRRASASAGIRCGATRGSLRRRRGRRQFDSLIIGQITSVPAANKTFNRPTFFLPFSSFTFLSSKQHAHNSKHRWFANFIGWLGKASPAPTRLASPRVAFQFFAPASARFANQPTTPPAAPLPPLDNHTPSTLSVFQHPSLSVLLRAEVRFFVDS
jgi:hypothetical protein